LPAAWAEDLLRRAYASFNARDIAGALALMHPEVDWPNGMEGGRELGHEAVRAYWARQFDLIDSHVDPAGFSEDDEGRVVVQVDQVVRDLDGTLLSERRLQHVYTLREGLIVRMGIHDS